MILDTETKFCACFGIHKIEDFKSRINPEESFYIEQGMNVESFKKLLIKNDMEVYEKCLLFYWYDNAFNRPDIDMTKVEQRFDRLKLRKEHEKTLTESLLFLLSNEDGKNNSITFQNSRNSLTITNKDITDTIIKTLKDEYEKNEYNETSYTVEETWQEFEVNPDKEWIKEWMLIDSSSEDRILNTEEIDVDDFIEKKNDRYWCMHCDYQDNHYRKRDINLELLNSKLKTLNIKSKRKAGAKPKNAKLSWVAYKLSLLKRVDKFTNNQDEFSEINNIKLTNKDYLFIHDCLYHFGMIEDSSKKGNTTTPEKMIYTMLKQFDNKRQNPILYDIFIKYNNLFITTKTSK